MVGKRFAPTLLFLGDILVFALSLWLTLLVRYTDIPTKELLGEHIPSFLILFGLWLLIFYMAGLYSKHVVLFKTALFGAIIRIQVLNIILAALFFFLAPGIGITPKTNLILYLVISLGLILAWRLYLFPGITKPSARDSAALIGEGPEVEELIREVNNNPRYSFAFSVTATPDEYSRDKEGFVKKLQEKEVAMLVVDAEHDALRSHLAGIYELSFISPGYQFVDFYQLYEEVFDRVPLSLLQYDWFLKNISTNAPIFYPIAKRAIDIVGGVAMGIITIIATPILFVLMRLEGPGPVFISQERIGQYGKKVRSFKFRSMRQNKKASGEWTTEEKQDNPITKVGNILRKTSLDEFPQFLNVLSGEISLIGPRNDIEGLGKRLGEAIPYYNIRYIVKPGITGWAQINQQYEQGNFSPQSVEETKMRLAYDFYYIKNRSIALEIVIALKTVKRLLFRVSSW